MEKMQMEKLYHSNVAIIYNRIRRYYYSRAIDFDDLVCHANLTFVEAYHKWDETRAEFGTYLWNTLDIELRNFTEKHKKNRNREISFELKTQGMDAPEINKATNTFNKNLWSKAPLESFNYDFLSPDDKEIIDAIFDARIPVEGKKMKITKYSITKYFAAKGWSHPRINQAFNRIENAISMEQFA